MMRIHPPRAMLLFLHSVNLSALLLGGVLLLTGVTRASQLIILAPVLGLLVVYGYRRQHLAVMAWYLGLALALLGWILLCEQLVILDKVLGTRISLHLRLGVRLATYAQQTLHTEEQSNEACCHDPLTWHYRPASRYRDTFDCPTCAAPYEVTVDETGYLNQPLGLWQRSPQIDLFLAGDSVLQGMGVPSVVERMRPQLPLRLWNLSIQAYGPRQKVNALLTYALPKAPRWLVVEFYAGNDLAEAIRDDVCQRGGDFRCRYNAPEIERRFAHHPLYATLFEVRTDVWARLADYTTKNLTLATTRYLLEAMKGVLKQHLGALSDAAPRPEAADAFLPTRLPPGAGAPAPELERPIATTRIVIAPWLALGGGAPAPVREGQWLTYLQAGLAATQYQYARLGAALAGMDHPPAGILLYNPSPYEVYRGQGMELNRWAEQKSALQRGALSAFARTQGWRFLDLTEPFRGAVRGGAIWLYGRYDQAHWSPQGTAIAADILVAELLQSVRVHED
ncbi:MAG TPA: hypothetical protein VLQ80_29435 [Candidatus Saccharimonadia bacterium]|nr:hypothetical protein [Candidatus Saccharimonadia bacterium]